MIGLQKAVKADSKSVVNWEVGESATILKDIHQKDVNIAIYERDINALTSEINHLIEQHIEIRTRGSINDILNEITTVTNLNNDSLIIQDIKALLHHFAEITEAKNFRLLLATINTNMCRRFHTDINDIRLLCTYSGPGTLWLTDDNINQKALNNLSDNESIVIEEDKIQQAKTGAVVLLKGAVYPQKGTKAIVHRSPTIEESGEKRLLLRIDTNDASILWT